VGFNQGILEGVDLWPKLSNLEVSGEKRLPHFQALPNVSSLGVLQAMISWVRSGNEARKAYVPSLHCVGSASVGMCAVFEHLIIYYNNLSPLDEVLSTFSTPGYCVASISPGSW